MTELGETDDARQLVPGDPTAVSATAKVLQVRADALEEAGVGLSRIDTVDGWSGSAGDAFRAKFRGQPGSWLQAADSFYKAAGALENYSTTLTWAQGRAVRAISLWNAAESATEQAQAQYQQYRQQGGTGPFQDPGEAGRTSARNLLNRARSDLKEAGDEVATVVGAERDKAPERPSFWSKVKDVASQVGATLENAGGHVVNALASVGNAVIHHPGDVAATVGGTALTAAGLTGELGGLVLDATVVGAPAGIVVNAVSAVGVVGQRPGQIHFQDKATRTKYLYNFETGEFDGMPNSLKKELAKKFPGYLDGIAKGKSALGE